MDIIGGKLMSIRYEDECVDCPPELGCLGSACPNRNVPYYICDMCEEELDDEDVYIDKYGVMVKVNGHICRSCLQDHFIKLIN